MNEDKSCAVIRDLLPLYMEQLTSEETNQIVEKHLDECISCNSLYNSMKEDSIRENEIVNENQQMTKEVDYLKKIRKNSKKKVWLGIGGTILLITVIALGKVFVYGSPSESYTANISIVDNKVRIQGTFTNSASVYSHYKIVNNGGQKKLQVYGAGASILNKKGTFEIECSLEEARNQGLLVENQKITESGHVISTRAAEIYSKKHPYIGDMSKNNELANAIGIRQDLGAYRNELQTKVEPYGWNFNFQTILEETNEKIYNDKMRGYAYVLLATVDNVNEITWSYTVKTKEGTKEQAVTLTRLEATKILGSDIKSFGQSEEKLEELLVKVGIVENGK